jgi:molecular chaperone GrpE (heat shock protein)
VPIGQVAGRLPSSVLGLHLEANGLELRFRDPATGEWLPTLQEQAERERAGRVRAEDEAERERAGRVRAEDEAERERAGRARAEAAVTRIEKGFKELRAELEALKRKIGS